MQLTIDAIGLQFDVTLKPSNNFGHEEFSGESIIDLRHHGTDAMFLLDSPDIRDTLVDATLGALIEWGVEQQISAAEARAEMRMEELCAC